MNVSNGNQNGTEEENVEKEVESVTVKSEVDDAPEELNANGYNAESLSIQENAAPDGDTAGADPAESKNSVLPKEKESENSMLRKSEDLQHEEEKGSEDSMSEKTEDLRHEEKKESGIKSFFSTLFDFITTFITALIVIIAVAFVVIRLLGWQMYTVDSSSMTPTYPVDTLVIVQTVEPEEIAVGDVITYVLNEDGVLVTHRVISVDYANQTFTTKGDANESADASPVLWANVVGRVFVGIPNLGKPMRYITAEENRSYVIGAIVGLFVISILWDIISDRKKKKAKKADGETEGKISEETGQKKKKKAHKKNEEK